MTSQVCESLENLGYAIFDVNLEKPENLKVLSDLVDRLAAQHPEAHQSGFFELYHDKAVADVRQDPNLYQLFADIYQTEQLWVMFDRMIYMTANKNDKTPLPLHVDQNPHQHPDFHGVQGLLALRDCNEHTGMLSLIPESHKWFAEKYSAWSDSQQGWIAYAGDDLHVRQKELIPIPLKRGQMVIWDSRVTHSRVLAKEPVQTRSMMMLSYLPVAKNNTDDCNQRNAIDFNQRRVEAYRAGTGVYDHDAGLRKTGNVHGVQSLRQTPEVLTELGQRLYGLKPWPAASWPSCAKNTCLDTYNLRVLMVAEEYGFGPPSNIATLMPMLRKRALIVDYAGCGHTLDLNRNLSYNNVFDMTKRNTDDEWSNLLVRYDVVVVAMDFRVARLAKKVGCKVAVFDTLFWYWQPESVSIVRTREADLYLAQHFMGVKQRVNRLELADKVVIVPPLVDVISTNAIDNTTLPIPDVLVNFGGLFNPTSGAEVIQYATTMKEAIETVCDEFRMTVKFIGSRKLGLRGVDPVSPAEAFALLNQCKIAFMTGGLGNIHDSVRCTNQSNTIAWMPPTNPSQLAQLVHLKVAGLMKSYSCVAWSGIVNNQTNDDEKSHKIAQENLEVLADEIYVKYKYSATFDPNAVEKALQSLMSLLPLPAYRSNLVNIIRAIFSTTVTVTDKSALTRDPKNLLQVTKDNSIIDFHLGRFLATCESKTVVPQNVYFKIRGPDNVHQLINNHIDAATELQLQAHLPGVTIETRQTGCKNDLDFFKTDLKTSDGIHHAYWLLRQQWIAKKLFCVHGICLLARDNKTVVIVVAPSGMGKTTLALKALLEAGCKIISGDKTLVRIDDNGTTTIVSGTRALTVLAEDFDMTWRTNDKLPIISAVQTGQRVTFVLDGSCYSIGSNSTGPTTTEHVVTRIVKLDVHATPTDHFSSATEALHQLLPHFLDKSREDLVLQQSDGTFVYHQAMKLPEHILSNMAQRLHDAQIEFRHMTNGACLDALKDMQEIKQEIILQKVILYGICGLGSGHRTRAIPVIEYLINANYHVIIVSHGQESMRSLKAKFSNQLEHVTFIQVNNPYLPGSQDGVDLAQAAANPANAELTWRDTINAMAEIKRAIGNRPLRLVISDYEQVVAQYAYMHRVKRFMTYDQQSKYLVGDFPEKLGETSYIDEVQRLSMFFPTATARLAISFFRVWYRWTNIEVEILPPMIKPEILNLAAKIKETEDDVVHMETKTNNHILVYLTNASQGCGDKEGQVAAQCAQQWIDVLERFVSPKTTIVVYMPAFLTNSITSANVIVKKCGTQDFYDDLGRCNGVISTAGHMLLSECMYLRKPVLALAIPTLYEQQMNAKAVHDGGFGLGVHNLTLTDHHVNVFMTNLDKHRQAIKDDETKGEASLLMHGTGNEQIFKFIDNLLK